MATTKDANKRGTSVSSHLSQPLAPIVTYSDFDAIQGLGTRLARPLMFAYAVCMYQTLFPGLGSRLATPAFTEGEMLKIARGGPADDH